jgi:hypothetical protein
MSKQEQTWEYSCDFLFNNRKITKFTLTDHYQENHPELTKELIYEIFLKLAEEEKIEPTKYLGKRKVYKWEKFYQNKEYRLIFWFDDHNPHGLWIRNCYPID